MCFLRLSDADNSSADQILLPSPPHPSVTCPPDFVAFTQSQVYMPPSPPVAFTVPWDVFYPFFIPTSGGAATALPTDFRKNFVGAVFIVLLAPAVVAVFAQHLL